MLGVNWMKKKLLVVVRLRLHLRLQCGPKDGRRGSILGNSGYGDNLNSMETVLQRIMDMEAELVVLRNAVMRMTGLNVQGPNPLDLARRLDTSDNNNNSNGRKNSRSLSEENAR